MNDSTPPQPKVVGLNCPKCGHPRSRVLYTRAAVGGRLRRRRACRRCGARVTTWEHIVGRAGVAALPTPDGGPSA
jgi:hypothetical protein